VAQVTVAYQALDDGVLVRQIVESLRKTLTTWQVTEARDGQLQTRLKPDDVLLILIGPAWVPSPHFPAQVETADELQKLVDRAVLISDLMVLPVLLNDVVIAPTVNLSVALRALVERGAFGCHAQSYEADIRRLVQSLRVRTPKRSRVPWLWIGLATILILGVGAAFVIFRSQAFKSALSSVNQAVERLDTYRPAVYTEQGWGAYIAGNYAQAVLHFQRAIELEANYVEAFDGLGWSYYSLKEYDKAEASFTRQIELAPFTAKSYVERGYFYHNIGKPAEAIQDFERVLDQIPNNQGVYLTLALSYQAIGNHDKARLAFERVTQLDPGNPDAYYGLGTSYDALGQSQQALQSFQRYLELVSEPDPTIVRRVEELKQEVR
jgi:Flp pilus assembly protein TadD